MRFDENIQGPRGRFGPWSFAGNGRQYVSGEQGKDTFVGAMLTDAARRPLTLDAALQVVTAEVRLRRDGTHWKAGRFLSADERLSTVVGPDFGSLSVRYTVSPPYERHQRGELLPWQGTQAWYLGRDRLVGLVTLETTRDDRRAGVWGRIRLGMDRVAEPAGANAWRYGGLTVKLHGHNYAAVETRPSETRFDDPASVRRSSEITLLDRAGGATETADALYRAGSRWWFVVEVYPQGQAGAASAAAVERIDRAGLSGFRLREPGRETVVLHNPGAQPLRVDRRALGLANDGWTRFADQSDQGLQGGQGKPLSAGDEPLVVAPDQHLVLRRTAG